VGQGAPRAPSSAGGRGFVAGAGACRGPVPVPKAPFWERCSCSTASISARVGIASAHASREATIAPAAFAAQQQAVDKGCDQVVWLDAAMHEYVEEMGGMNLYFVYGDRIVTPELSGSLLPGITRDSLLSIAADLGYEVSEGRISVDDWRSQHEDGTLTEVFACGTAAVITPVGSVKSTRASWPVADGAPGQVTMRLREALLDIQTGRAADPHAWMHPLGA